MAISLARLGVWKLIAAGVSLTVLHVLLLPRWPQLSPLYHGPRPVAARIMLIFEFLILLAAATAAFGTVSNAQSRKNEHPILAVGGWIAYALLYAWALRQS